MSKKSLYLLGILLTMILGSFLYLKFCCKNNDNETSNEGKNEIHSGDDLRTASVFPFIVEDADGNLLLEIDENFNFEISSANFMTPISEDLKGELTKLKEYLLQNKGKSLSITGYYNADEANNSIYPNLGLARANSVKNYLASMGVPVNLIDTYGELNEDLVANTEGYFNGASEFNVANAVDDSEALKNLGDSIRANPLVLHFKTGESFINLTSLQRQKIANISRYLDKIEEALAIVTGHTDNTGDPENHVSLGQRRADFAKSYFVKNGISESKIVANSKGDTEPIADNETEVGRAKNRRTVITIN